MIAPGTPKAALIGPLDHCSAPRGHQGAVFYCTKNGVLSFFGTPTFCSFT
jgi:hypothetical protein